MALHGDVGAWSLQESEKRTHKRIWPATDPPLRKPSLGGNNRPDAANSVANQKRRDGTRAEGKNGKYIGTWLLESMITLASLAAIKAKAKAVATSPWPVEYGVMLTLIIVVALSAIAALGTENAANMSKIANQLPG